MTPRRNPYLIVGIALVAFVFFAGVLAALTFRIRVGSGSGAWTPPALTSTPGTPVAVGQVTRTLTAAPPTGTATATPTATATSTVTATATPSPTASPSGKEACRGEVAPELAPLYSAAELGCATGPAAVVWSAWEPFERGAMFWRSDTDGAYILVNDGRWLPITEPWNGEPPAGRGAPPAGLVAPERGFGWVWSNRDDVFEALGWATEREKGFCALLQPFARGFLLRSTNVPSCTPDNLYNFATDPSWRPLALSLREDGWQRAATGAQTGGGESAPAVARPAAQGRFTAPAFSATLDGEFDEWPGAWQPVTAVVSGPQERTGAADFAARFQLAWDADGLYLALEVTDDVYRAGPQNTRMWQGDGIEINLDRDLAGDFADPSSSADDYQIGLSYGPNLDRPRGYRWLPFAEESRLEIAAVALEIDTGYTVEAHIPWSAFGMAAPTAGATFGFNLAVNDNDGNAPAQQTVLASSPARLTHDNPTQWGTLTLED